MPRIGCDHCDHQISMNLGERVGRDTIFVCPVCHEITRVVRGGR